MVLPQDPRGASSTLTPGAAETGPDDDFFSLTFAAPGDSAGGPDMDTGEPYSLAVLLLVVHTCS